MSIKLKIPDIRELKPRITVFGVGGAGGNGSRSPGPGIADDCGSCDDESGCAIRAS
jgi:cell division protein FtsZ